MSKRSRAFSGCISTIGPRSSSRALVAMSRATRKGRLSVSSATVCSNDDVAFAELHHQTPPEQPVQGALHEARLDAQCLGQLAGCRLSEPLHGLPHVAFVIGQLPNDSDAVVLLEDERQSAPLQYRLDRLPVLFGHASEEKVRVVR